MKRVLVAMSGGVDSSVAAALLARSGYEVVGITLRLWNGNGGFSETGCCTALDAADARRVASQLGIDYYVFDLVEPFEEKVVTPFIESYSMGLTPNPCVECNRSIKFSILMDRAAKLGCDFVATGHHARIRRPDGPQSDEEGSESYKLLRGKDPAKDQSYVLYMLDQKTLGRLLLPIGEMTKSQVRKVAATMGLRTASKPESQDVCFVGKGGVENFLSSRKAPLERFRVVDDHGNDLGFVARNALTVGQRRRLGVSAGSRLYVKDIDPESGTVTMAPKEKLFRTSLEVFDFNWVSGTPPSSAIHAEVQVRYNASPTPAKLFPLSDGRVRIEFDEPVWAPAPGQIAAAYRGEELLGGGVIDRHMTEVT